MPRNNETRKRQTFDVLVQNIPKSITQRDISKKFTPYGEICSIYNKGTSGDTQEATVRFLCEPDATKAIKENNNTLWGTRLILAKRVEPRTKGSGHGRPFYKPSPPNLVKPPQNDNCFTQSYISNMDRHMPSEIASPVPTLATPEVREISITYIDDCTSFYGVCSLKNMQLTSLTNRLQVLCPVLPCVKSTPSFDKVYGAVYSVDQNWYRCKALGQKAPGLFRVRFIDYGNAEDVRLDSIVELPDSMSSPPCLAPKCVLDSLEPVFDKKQHKEGTYYFQEHFLGNTVTITSYSPVDSPVYRITECRKGDMDVIKTLVDKKFARYRDMSQSRSSPSIPQPYEKILPPQSEGLFTSFSTSYNFDFGDSKFQASQYGLPAKNNFGSLPRKKNFGSNKAVKPHNAREQTNDFVVFAEKDALRSEIATLKHKLQELEKQLKEKDAEITKFSIIKELEAAASHIQLVNSIRSNPPQTDLDLSRALSMLLAINDVSSQTKKALEKKTEEVLSSYHVLLNDITNCLDKNAQGDLIAKKNACKEYICKYTKEYLELCDETPQKNLELDNQVVEETIKKLRKKERSTADVSLGNSPSSIDDIMLEYNTTLITKKELTEKLKKDTDIAHAKFMSLMEDILKAFPLYSVENPIELLTKNVPFFSVEGIFTSTKLKDAVTSLRSALEVEVNSVYTKSSKPTIIGCVIQELKNSLEKKNKEKNIIERYRAILEDLSSTSSLPNKLTELSAVKQNIKAIKSKLRHALVDKKDLEEGEHSDAEIVEINDKIRDLQCTLHKELKHEDDLLNSIAKSCKTNYPEFSLQHPELALATYMQYDGILKQNWEIDIFNCRGLSDRCGICYEATFADDPVVIKEFLLDSEEKSKRLLDRIVKWNSLKCSSLVPITAAFRKNERQLYIMFPKWPTWAERTKTYSKSECVNILTTVLESLKVLHKEDLVHGMLHPTTLLLDQEGKILLDFCFENRYPVPPADCKEPPYQAPELAISSTPTPASDIFAFGCLLLSMYPELKFTCSSRQNIDISPNEDLIKEMLSVDNVAAVIALVHPNPQKRPTADYLLEHSILESANSWADHCEKLDTVSPDAVPLSDIQNSEPESASSVSLSDIPSLEYEHPDAETDAAVSTSNNSETSLTSPKIGTLEKLIAYRETFGCNKLPSENISAENVQLTEDFA